MSIDPQGGSPARSPEGPEDVGATGRRSRISRRAFVAGSAVAGTGAAALGYAGLMIVRDNPRPEFDRSSPTGVLAPREMATVLGLSEVLVPDRIRVPPARIRRLVDAATQVQAGALKEYRSGAALLETMAARVHGTAFADLAVGRREGIIDRLLWRYPAGDDDALDDLVARAKRRLEGAWQDDERRRFRHLVVRDLLVRLYAAAVPALVGYSNLPGVPGDPRAYASPPAG